MKIWFDTEFYERSGVVMGISIGMIREDGKTYYVELMAVGDVIGLSEWHANNVAQHMKGFHYYKTRAVVQRDLVEFCGESPQFWAYYADYDWVVLCQIFGRMVDLPETWPKYCLDLKQSQVTMAPGLKLPEAAKGTKHDALNDAKWCQAAFLYLQAHVDMPLDGQTVALIRPSAEGPEVDMGGSGEGFVPRVPRVEEPEAEPEVVYDYRVSDDKLRPEDLAPPTDKLAAGDLASAIDKVDATNIKPLGGVEANLQTANVTRLDGTVVKPPSNGPVVDPELISLLEGLLKDARTGELSSFAFSAVRLKDGSTSAFHVGGDDTHILLLGTVSRLMHNIQRSVDE